jgi:hypothetical protein
MSCCVAGVIDAATLCAGRLGKKRSSSNNVLRNQQQMRQPHPTLRACGTEGAHGHRCSYCNNALLNSAFLENASLPRFAQPPPLRHSSQISSGSLQC